MRRYWCTRCKSGKQHIWGDAKLIEHFSDGEIHTVTTVDHP